MRDLIRLVEQAEEMALDQIQFVFHGTPEEETAESLRQGIDPKKFEGGYFGWGFYVTEDGALARSNYAGREGYVFQYELLRKDRILDLRVSEHFLKWRDSGFANRISDPSMPRQAIARGIDGVYDRSMGGMCVYNPKILRLVKIDGPLTEARLPSKKARAGFLEAVEMWASEMHNNDYESNKPMLEKDLFRFEKLTLPYRDVRHRTLFRLTGGLSSENVKAIRAGKTVHLEMSEGALSSWTTNPQVAEYFIERYYEHFDADCCAVILAYPTSELEVFLDLSQLWEDLNDEDKSHYSGINIGVSEREVIVRHPPTLAVNNSRVYGVFERPSEDDDEEEIERAESQEDVVRQLRQTIPPPEARQKLTLLGQKWHPDRAERVPELVAALDDSKLYELLYIYMQKDAE